MTHDTRSWVSWLQCQNWGHRGGLKMYCLNNFFIYWDIFSKLKSFHLSIITHHYANFESNRSNTVEITKIIQVKIESFFTFISIMVGVGFTKGGNLATFVVNMVTFPVNLALWPRSFCVPYNLSDRPNLYNFTKMMHNTFVSDYFSLSLKVFWSYLSFYSF